MRIHVNGTEREEAPGTTLGALVDRLGLAREGIAVARNGQVVPRGQLDRTSLEEGDRIEIVRAVGGG